MRAVTVHVRLPSGASVPGADLAIDDEVSRTTGGGSFRYRQEYLDHPGAYSFDPIHLPLGRREVSTEGLPGVPLVVAEALPDRWGRRLLARTHRVGEDDVPSLLQVARPPTIGGLRFVAEEEEIPAPDLGELIETAGRIEAGLPVEAPRLARLLRHGSSVGGARPKALFRDDHGEYLAKFPSVSDPAAWSIPRLEASCLDLAAAAGLDACQFRLISAADRDVLLVHRFDVLAAGGRKHVLSLRALGSRPDGRVYSYRELASLVRRVATDVDECLETLFRQMVFNVAIGNTDDHEGNFSLLFDGRSWSLSPAYDLLPDVGERIEHALDFDASPLAPGRRRIVGLGHSFNLPPDKAAAIVDNVVGTVAARWREICRGHGIEPNDQWPWVRELELRVRSLEP